MVVLKDIKKLKAVVLISCIWIVFYFIAVFGGKVNDLANVGINVIGNEYYRIFTGMLIHIDLVHILSNILALYWIGVFIEEYMGSVKFFVFGIVSGAISNLIFTLLFKENQGSIGGSVITFSLIGVIIFSQIFDKGAPRLRLKTWCGNWILWYSILSNIPIFGADITRTMIHIIAFIVGFVVAGISYSIVKIKKEKCNN